MKIETQFPAYSYRSDPAVPDFDDDGPVAFMDGECALCTRGARLIARYDRSGQIRICPVLSPTGTAVMRHYGLDPAAPDSWLMLIDGRAYTSLDAIIRAGTLIGGAGHLLSVFRLLPRPVQDWLYRRLARNRFRIAGRTDMCAVPDPALRRRLIG
ncbi:MAG: DCC1-like thiol-disulfide oxidoreductase family protein [Pseudomonadota bacterium]